MTTLRITSTCIDICIDIAHTPSVSKKKNLELDVTYSRAMNLDRCMSRFVVLKCVTYSYVSFLWDGESRLEQVSDGNGEKGIMMILL